MIKRYITAAFVVLSLILAGFYQIASKNVPLSISKVDEALFSNSNQSNFFSWDKKVFIHLISSDESVHISLQKLIGEINGIVGYNKISLGSLDLAQIVIITSETGFNDFSIEYKRLFQLWFGTEETNFWDKKAAFDFPYDETHQCFGFGLYNPKNYAIQGYVDKNRPEKFLISIGNVSAFTDQSLMGCVREEVAHGVFFIRDFIIENPDFSIFNANAMPDLIEDFSHFDRALMYYIANTPSIVGKSRNSVSRQVQEYLNDTLN